MQTFFHLSELQLLIYKIRGLDYLIFNLPFRFYDSREDVLSAKTLKAYCLCSNTNISLVAVWTWASYPPTPHSFFIVKYDNTYLIDVLYKCVNIYKEYKLYLVYNNCYVIFNSWFIIYKEHCMPSLEITWRVVNRGVGGGEGGKVQRISSIDDRWKIDRGRVKIV